MPRGYLTPDSIPSPVLCRALRIPNSVDWVAIVTGAILDLTYPGNYEQFGTLTPDECAERMLIMLGEFIDDTTICRMIGELIPYAGASSPTALWLVCDGASLLRSEYPDLFAVIGTAYGAPDGTHFNIPDLRGRTLIGASSTYPLAGAIGATTHTLTEAEMPVHSHAYDPVIIPDVDLEDLGLPQGNAAQIIPFATENTYSAGSGQAHNNMQPSMPITYLIVAKDR
jgi:microcystin-dependent protein